MACEQGQSNTAMSYVRDRSDHVTAGLKDVFDSLQDIQRIHKMLEDIAEHDDIEPDFRKCRGEVELLDVPHNHSLADPCR